MNSLPRRGFSIQIFLPDGTPDGLRIVEKSNWTGCGVVCPRSQFPDAKGRSEFAKTGVYILIGPSVEGDLPTIYIGEGDPVRPRIEQHFARKDFWTSLILFTSKDENLNKAHVQYLEARLITLAWEAKRSVIDNGNSPQLPSLSEPDIAAMESFLEEMLLIYPVLSLTAFEKPRSSPPTAQLLYLKSKGIAATGYEAAQGFVIMAGSQAVTRTVPSIHRYLIEFRDSLIQKGIFVPEKDFLRLSQDYTFNSPSTAAGIMLGRSANGRIEWQDKQGRTLKAIQESSVRQSLS